MRKPETSPPGDMTSKHRRISEELLNKIEEGRWRPGDQLPSEELLAAEADASLGTMRRALRTLVEMGVVERHHGRGTFVSGARAQDRQLRHFRFMSKGGTQLLPVYFNVEDVTITDETGAWSDFLQDPTGNFVRIRRIASINGEFDVFSEVYLPCHRFGDVSRMSRATLNGVSIRDMLAERFNAPTLDARQTIICEALPPRVSRMIGTPAAQFGIVWTVAGTSYRGAPITWQRIFVPPSDRVIEIAPGHGPGSASSKERNMDA
ncbi:MAG: GntR family transcriptional regulator [Pikeienuella sp.]